MKSIPAAHGFFGLAMTLAAITPAAGQSVGFGASPGRAAYRPSGQWNNGPFYTSPHINPYAPHRAGTTNLYAAEPLVPPWTSGPHGRYSTFYPGEGALFPYAEGFSPYSGYSDWYAQANRVESTREVVQQARTLFFRSAPLPPAGVLPPLPPPVAGTTPVVARARAPRAEKTGVKVVVPGAPAPRPPRSTFPVYRSSVTGLP